ncbi:Protein O-mannosyltransferase 2 [Coemansia spiralis]|uniref:Dolichyl-phosphate-mannose--protein mannosyltransferase n=1 Tax=Coemansia spiralis TaxID=417178 RepID=A0A9W8GLS5_9FUNG|nr:Protein O-mannosyltransferase 2 [Coemansia spiralis]
MNSREDSARQHAAKRDCAADSQAAPAQQPTGSKFVAYPLRREPVSTSAPYQRNKWNSSVDGWLVLLLTVICAFTRLYQIGLSNRVSWDESYFNVRFSGMYLNHSYHHDVHPPLAKLLISLSRFVADGSNRTMEPKGNYPPDFNYTFTRCFTALFGIGLAPLAYLTCFHLNMQRQACFLAGLLVIADNALCVMSRFVLLDAPLLFFTAAALCSIAGFQNTRHCAFSPAWWRWLLLTGAALGLVSSSKWVGFFAVALVGLYTMEELLNMYADFMPASTAIKHFGARVTALIILPIAIYMASFAVHFAVLSHSGPGDATMPPAFQARLYGSKLSYQPFTVMYGSLLDLRSMHPGSGLLHSHPHKYPDGSQQQQVTGYSHSDSNNNWVIMRIGNELNYTSDPLLPVKDGDTVRLMHKRTSTMLHSHRSYKAHVSTHDHEVTAYGKPEWNDTNNEWRIEIHKEESSVANGEIHAITTQFRLRHATTNCLLSAAGVKLPPWGFRQTEVSCSRSQSPRSAANLWVVERHANPRVPSVDMRSIVKTSFISNFLRLNMEMARSNNALIPDRDKYNHLESDPWSWPFLVYPMRLLGSWKKGDIKYYEVGNPLIWWSSALMCLLYPLQLAYYHVRQARGVPGVWAPGEERHFWNAGKLLWGGWMLHYLPFFAMGRVTYIHHYLPALYFAVLLLAFEVDHFCRRLALGERPRTIVVAMCAVCMLAVFCWFAPLTFGYIGPMDDLKYRQWLPTWNIYRDKYSM